MINDWMLSLDRGDYVVAAFLDMSKAFDTVSHAVLLSELLEIGVGPVVLPCSGSVATLPTGSNV